MDADKHFKCGICLKKFKTSSTLLKHQIGFHSIHPDLAKKWVKEQERM